MSFFLVSFSVMALVFMSAHRCELISCRGSVVNFGTHRGRGIKEMQYDGTARALAKKKKKKEMYKLHGKGERGTLESKKSVCC